jgi:SAM-dependent methyltransferase
MKPGEILAINRSFYRENLGAYDRHVRALAREPGCREFASLLPKGARILDAGCGPGRDAVKFMRLGCRVIGVDSSPEMVALCRSRGVDARLGTLQSLRFRGSFDAVWACASLIHVPKSHVEGTLMRLVGALKPGGYLYLTLWEGRGEGLLADGRFMSLYSHSGFKRLVGSLGQGKVVHSWRTPRAKAVYGLVWMGFLVRKR